MLTGNLTSGPPPPPPRSRTARTRNGGRVHRLSDMREDELSDVVGESPGQSLLASLFGGSKRDSEVGSLRGDDSEILTSPPPPRHNLAEASTGDEAAVARLPAVFPGAMPDDAASPSDVAATFEALSWAAPAPKDRTNDGMRGGNLEGAPPSLLPTPVLGVPASPCGASEGENALIG